MKISTNLILLLGALFFLSLSTLQAQDIQYSQDQIVGKWVLKSASFNGNEISMKNCKDRVSFEFSNDGNVKYISFDGKTEKGIFILKENRLIDPRIPEYPNADILELTANGMVLEMKEDQDKVLMTFEIAGLE